MKDDLISRSALVERLKRNLNACNPGTFSERCYQDAINTVTHFPAVDAGPKWISVEDRLPETESRCLVVRYDAVTKTSFIDILWFDKGTWWNRVFGGEYSVTHWMPLPEPPKEG